MALSIASNPAPWQRCIHGGETMLREQVTRELVALGKVKTAFRYAACGLADSIVKTTDGAKVSPMGCGHRLCPRCGRQRGRPMIQRIFGWLAAEPHGDILTMCLTQPILKGESLVAARARMRKKEIRYQDAVKELGCVAGASCTHIVWSNNAEGWHYHVHLLLEFPKGTQTPEGLRALWLSVCGDTATQAGEGASRLVVEAGAADSSLVGENADPDFWSESKGKLAVAVQYPVRDIAQGISAVRCGGDEARVRECVAVLLKSASGWKLRRTFGKWRKPPPDVVQAKPEGESAASSPGPGVASKPEVRLGTVHRMSRLAVRGDKESAYWFTVVERSVRNNTEFGRRFVAFCRRCSLSGSS